MNLYPTKYIIRLDDACHQMPLEKWKLFEHFFDKKNISPIVGVVPKNKDKSLGSGENQHFWSLVHRWEKKGWAIAMHGLYHQCHKINSNNSYFKFGNKSEFVGKSIEEQTKIIQSSLESFKKNGVSPKIFMAPSHTFDTNTIKALESVTSIRIITDGFSFRSFKKGNFIFIPQQLWSVKRLPFGLYTICIHPTSMELNQIHQFIEELDQISDQIISPDDINLDKVTNQGFLDLMFEKIYLFIARYKFKEN